jgi:transposase
MKDIFPEIRMATNHHDINNIRKWIHRFNEKGIEGVMPRKHKHKHKPVKISVDIETKIVEIASKNPRMLWITYPSQLGH